MFRDNASRHNRSMKLLDYSSFCSVLKVIVFLIGVFNIVVVFLINTWQISDPVSVTYVRTPIIIEERKTYSDLVNYAADYNGALIVKTHETQSEWSKILKFQKDNPPDYVLNQDNSKGKCWGFDGNKGFVQIKTQKKIYPQHFTFKHSNLINFDSAPKEICIYSAQENEILLGCYEFFLSKARPDPEFVQTFECLDHCEKPADEFKFEINSNHGSEITCIYQILVHGEPAQFTY